MALLDAIGIEKSFGGVRAVSGVDFTVSEGEAVGIIGPNGAGKTTLFNILSGLQSPDAGEILFKGRTITHQSPEKRAELGIIRTFQHGRVCGNLSVFDNVAVGASAAERIYREGPFGTVREVWDAIAGGARVRERARREAAAVEAVLARFGERLLPRKQDAAYSLSYANRRRTELARALAAKPVILLLDEPTAGMNQSETREMTELLRDLKRRGQTLVVIEHKMDLIAALCDRLVVMDDGLKIAEGDPLRVQSDTRVIDAYLGAAAAASPRAALEAVNI